MTRRCSNCRHCSMGLGGEGGPVYSNACPIPGAGFVCVKWEPPTPDTYKKLAVEIARAIENPDEHPNADELLIEIYQRITEQLDRSDDSSYWLRGWKL